MNISSWNTSKAGYLCVLAAWLLCATSASAQTKKKKTHTSKPTGTMLVHPGQSKTPAQVSKKHTGATHKSTAHTSTTHKSTSHKTAVHKSSTRKAVPVNVDGNADATDPGNTSPNGAANSPSIADKARASASYAHFTGVSGGDAPYTGNNILQDTSLYRFFSALTEADSNIVSILHLGDSHIQAGFFSNATADLLEQDFGSAGRGYVFPYTVAGTNGPGDYRFNSNNHWNTDRVIDRSKPDPLGPGAIAISTQSEEPALAYNGRENDLDNSVVAQAELFYDAGTEEADVVAPDAGVDVSGMPFSDSGEGVRKATLTFKDPVASFQVRWVTKSNHPFRFYGAMLYNGHNGILFNAVGINGAMYQQYNESSNTLTAAMQVMQPQLVIISLGTNEAFGSMNASSFRNQIDETVQTIRRAMPGVCIMLTTPAEAKRTSKRAFRRKIGKKKYATYYKISYYPNPYVAVATQTIMSYCRENGIACWNFNGLSKTGTFAGAWQQDHIHFNVHGYQEQGRLMYEAIHQSYTKYLKEVKKQKHD
jgi:lysophospholipase L1-like esterase